MNDFDSGFPPKRAVSRRAYWRTIILTVCTASVFTVCAAFVLTVLVCCYAVTMFATTLLKGLGDFGGALIVFAALMTIPWLLELLSLLSTGQLIPFVMRLLQLLGSS
jgi:hypothetical protein